MPFLLFLLSVATLVAVSSKSKAAGGGHAQTFTLDANMPEPLRNQVLAALVSGTDPSAIDAFATAIQAQYPLAAGLLHAKATALRSGGMPSLPAASSDPGGPPLDAAMPASMVAFVHTELLNETDPNKLVALANTLAGQYPIASALLAQRAAVLNVQPNAPAAPANPQPVVQPQPQPAPSPANPSAPALTIPGLDPGIPADLAQAVMTELATDTDPNKLQTYAQEIQSQYPMAASLLSAKANSLIALAQSLTPPTPTAVPPASPIVAPPPIYPTAPSVPAPPPVIPVVAPPPAQSGRAVGPCDAARGPRRRSFRGPVGLDARHGREHAAADGAARRLRAGQRAGPDEAPCARRAARASVPHRRRPSEHPSQRTPGDAAPPLSIVPDPSSADADADDARLDVHGSAGRLPVEDRRPLHGARSALARTGRGQPAEDEG